MSGYKQGNPDCWVLLHIDDLVSETDAPGIKNGTVTANRHYTIVKIMSHIFCYS